MPIEVTTSMLEKTGLIREHGPHRILETASLADYFLSGPGVPARGSTEDVPGGRRSSVQHQSLRVSDLIGAWLADESGHDERFWPIFERDLAEAE